MSLFSRTALIVAVAAAVAACGGPAELPTSRPGDLVEVPATGDSASRVRVELSRNCTEGETDIALEGLAIQAATARRAELSAAEAAALDEREAAFATERGTLTPGCRDTMATLS